MNSSFPFSSALVDFQLPNSVDCRRDFKISWSAEISTHLIGQGVEPVLFDLLLDLSTQQPEITGAFACAIPDPSKHIGERQKLPPIRDLIHFAQIYYNPIHLDAA